MFYYVVAVAGKIMLDMSLKLSFQETFPSHLTSKTLHKVQE